MSYQTALAAFEAGALSPSPVASSGARPGALAGHSEAAAPVLVAMRAAQRSGGRTMYMGVFPGCASARS